MFYIKVLLGAPLSMAMFLLYSSTSQALPQGGVVVDGNAAINTAQNNMQINQSSNNAILNWQSFNIHPNEAVNFKQPSVNSIAINRINAANGASQILGQLTANGNIFLLNPSGILFGKNAQVNVGGILASTSDLNMEAYRQGKIQLMPNLNYNGSVINLGNITARDGGFAAFVAPNVVNSGIINARLGHIQLSSHGYFTVDLYGDGLINLKIPDELLNPELRNYSIINNGQIFADGGSIVISGNDAANIASSIISMEGLMQADSIANKEGSISLLNQKGSIYFASNSKTLARGQDLDSVGGYVKAVGENVYLNAASLIDVSGNKGGGSAYIGGNYQGKLLADNDFNAKHVTMDKDATVLADAKIQGDGGKIVLWSDDTTSVAGKLSANGGALNGNGGLIETSGKLALNILPEINVSATNPSKSGKTGLWLLDPNSLIVDDALASNLSAALNTNDVTISTRPESDNPHVPSGNYTQDQNGDIIFNNNLNPVQWNTENTFSVLAYNDILFNDSSTAQGVKIHSLGTGIVHLQTNADSTYHPNRGMIFYNPNQIAGGTASPTLQVIANSLIEYYINPIVGFTGARMIQPNSFMQGPSNEYHLVYNSGTNRTIYDAMAKLPVAAGNVGYALNDNIMLSEVINNDPIALKMFGNNELPYIGNFDGLGHTISGLNLINNSGNINLGLFAKVSTAAGPLTFKNVIIENPMIEASSELATSNGFLIGAAELANANSLTLDNITINNGRMNNHLDSEATIQNRFAGGLIGYASTTPPATPSTDQVLAGLIYLNNITEEGMLISSAGASGGLIGRLDNTGIVISDISVNGNINSRSTNNRTNGSFAGGLIGVADSKPGFSTPLMLIGDNISFNGSVKAMSNNNIMDNNLHSATSAGGLFGAILTGNIAAVNQIPIDITVAGNIEASNPMLDNSQAIQSAGGLFGILDGGLNFNPIITDFSFVGSVMSSSPLEHNNFTGAVIGYLGAAATAQSISPGVADFNFPQGNNACSGPNASLCVSLTNNGNNNGGNNNGGNNNGGNNNSGNNNRNTSSNPFDIADKENPNHDTYQTLVTRPSSFTSANNGAFNLPSSYNGTINNTSSSGNSTTSTPSAPTTSNVFGSTEGGNSQNGDTGGVNLFDESSFEFKTGGN